MWKLDLYMIFIFAYSICADDRQKCNLPLGMENGQIPDSAITASTGTDASKARLHGDGAWCFRRSEIEIGETVSLTIDLGTEIFISALLTQGPPLNLKNREYNYHIGFYIENSTEASNFTEWTPCCNTERKTYFGEDMIKESGTVKIHSFGMLILARKVRLRFETSIRWAGDDEKCFRIEILGCSEDIAPMTNFKMRALPSGWIEATWNKPIVYISNDSMSSISYSIPVLDYMVILKWSQTSGNETIENSTTMTVKAPRLTVPGPIWGAHYNVNIICEHQGYKMPCESAALVGGLELCNPSSTECTNQKKVVFKRPQKIRSWVIRPTNSEDETSNVFISWSSEGHGWVTRSIKITVTGENNIIEKVIDEEDHCLTLYDLKGPVFKLVFTPQANSLWYSASFDYELYIIPWVSLINGLSRNGFGAFTTDVTLEANVLWEGKMIVTWSQALVRDGDLINITDQFNATKMEIDLETQFTGEADVYNISLRETNDNTFLKSLSLSGSGDLIAEFLSLKLETQYEVNISCDYGGIVVECGELLIYTDLPFKLTELNSQMLVYDSLESGQGWHMQEESCKKSRGTLVSFGTMEEDLLLRAPLLKSVEPLVTFWIGLNMCPENNGPVWSDGSVWSHNNLPQTAAGLTAGTCCIKADYSKETKSYNWLGEVCDALLPAICEFKTPGLVGRVVNLKEIEVSTTDVFLQWQYEAEYWTPSAFTSTLCPTLDLTTFRPLPSPSCTTDSIGRDLREFQSRNLRIFTEFNVSVCAALPSLEFNGVNRTILVRTLPEKPVFLYLFSSGYVNVMWAQLVAEFKEDEEIEYFFYKGIEMDLLKTGKVPAKNLTLGDLELGEKYRIGLKEFSNRNREEIIDFFAFPPCDCTDCQDESRCIKPSDKQVPNSLASQQCSYEDSSLVISNTSDRLDILLRQADKVFDDLWVSGSSLKGKAIDTMDRSKVTRDQIISDAGNLRKISDVDPIETESKPILTNPQECLIVSRSQKSIIVATDCNENHYAACEQKAPLALAFPPTSDIATRVGATWLIIDWNPILFGWKANFTLCHWKSSYEKHNGAIKCQQFSSPPVLISDLNKNVKYSIQLNADLGRGFVSTSPEFYRITSSHGRSLGLSPLSNSGNSPKWMSAGWSPSPEFFLSHLICGALIITACISTMLLFFATGMFYQDCIAQLGFLSCILVAYLLLLVAHPHYVEERKLGCTVLSAILHFLFMAAFLFLALEALTMSHLLAERIKSPFENSNWALVLFATLLPMIYVIVSAAIIQIDYPDAGRDNCWVNINGPVLIVQCVPNAAILLLTIILIVNTIKSNEDNQPLLKDNEIRGRQSDSYRLRWVILALSVELGVVWSSGVAAFHLHTKDAHTIFNMSTLIMAITIIFARTWLDDTFRSKIHRLCCGTELTYKRSATMRTISARTRVAPNFIKDQRASSGFSTTTITEGHVSNGLPMYNLPNSPPPDHNNSTILIKRTYQFDDEM